MGAPFPECEGRDRNWRSLFVGALTLAVGAACTPAAAGFGTIDAGHDVSIDVGHRTGDLRSPALDAGAPPPAINCPPAPQPAFVPSTVVAAVVHRTACTSAAIAAYVSACLTSTDAGSACAAWASANLAASDAGTGTPCGNCIAAPNNGGALWLDPFGALALNYGGCIEVLVGPDGGACALAYDNARACRDDACNYCVAGGGDYASCAGAALQSVCKTFADEESASCVTALLDGSIASSCASTGANLTSTATDFARVINIICGGVPVDAATD